MQIIYEESINLPTSYIYTIFAYIHEMGYHHYDTNTEMFKKNLAKIATKFSTTSVLFIQQIMFMCHDLVMVFS